MLFGLFTVAVAVAFFFGSLALLGYGRKLGLTYLARTGATSMTGLAAMEGAIFALIGLLMAFATSGALQRYDERRQMVVQEANAVSNAFDRLSLFEPETARDLQAKLKAYVQARIDLYLAPHDLSVRGMESWSSEHLDRILDARHKLWDAASAACSQSRYHPVCAQAVPALSNAFDVARLRLAVAERHPPHILYVMLFGLALGGALLAGFGMAAAPQRSLVHMLIFAGSLTITLYVITDIEFPRLGLIRIDGFDHFLDDALAQMRLKAP